MLSGILSGLGGSPGAIQAWRLRQLWISKQDYLAELELDSQKIEAEAERLEKSRFAQEREIRRVLGYAALDEIIFDFSGEDREPVGSTRSSLKK